MLDSAADLAGRRVLQFKGNTDCRYVLPAALGHGGLIKIFIDECERCSFVIECSTLTSLLEVTHCRELALEIRRPTHTIQLDLNEVSV
jgi:hypothetical protein